MFIYVITNTVTGKIYIGQHKGNSLKKYLQTKLSDASKHRGGQSRLYNSMRKHPKEVWSIEPLMEVETKEELDRLEKLLIALYDTRNPEIGYNICKGGEGFTGTHSLEAREKIGKASKAAWLDPNYRVNFSEKMKGHPVSDKTINRLRALRGSKASEETKHKLSEAHKGNTHSEKTKAKMSVAHMGHETPMDTRKKLGVSKRGNRNPMKNPEVAKKVSQALTGRSQPVEVNEKRATKMRLVWANRKSSNILPFIEG